MFASLSLSLSRGGKGIKENDALGKKLVVVFFSDVVLERLSSVACLSEGEAMTKITSRNWKKVVTQMDLDVVRQSCEE